MSANSRFAVAVHSLVALAYVGGPMTSGQLAENTVNTNPVVLRRILARLVRAGIVEGQSGKSGGFSLGRDPRSIDLSEVYAAVEDGGVFGVHANAVVPSCPVSRAIRPALREVFRSAESALRESLAGVSLADLVRKVRTAEKKAAGRR